MEVLVYAPDRSDREWKEMSRFLPPPKHGRPRKHARRLICDAIFYLVRADCAWPLLPGKRRQRASPSSSTCGPTRATVADSWHGSRSTWAGAWRESCRPLPLGLPSLRRRAAAHARFDGAQKTLGRGTYLCLAGQRPAAQQRLRRPARHGRNPKAHSEAYDTSLLGSGEGGKCVAGHLASLDKRVAMIEHRYVGGSCPNIACLPSKNIVHSAKVASYFRRSEEFSISKVGWKIDMAGVRVRKRAMVDGLVQRHLERYKKTGVELILGPGRFVAPKTLEVTLNDGSARTCGLEGA